ncbi:MAG: diacylglycerol kinase family lipid kinase [Chloroflexi bacterium]|nr:diacylglycerol kinase family lipid kinase [Chloroflexota bacterium]
MVKGQRWSIIANPVSGRGKGRRMASRVAELLTRAGVDVDLEWTTRQGDAEQMAIHALEKGVRGLLICGGDGTLHEAINGLFSGTPHPEEVVIGLIPAGRCNDFRACLDLPKEPRRIVDAVLYGKTRRVDLGRVGTRYYATVATLGFDSAVSQYIADGRAPRFLAGTPAYLYGVFVQLVRYRDIRVCLRGDSLDFEGPVFLAATGNTPNYGGRLMIAPGALVDDGLLDLCLVRSVSRRDVLRMLPRIFNGSHVKHSAVSLHQVRTLSIETEEPMWIWADGERVARTPATIEVVPGALSVLESP